MWKHVQATPKPKIALGFNSVKDNAFFAVFGQRLSFLEISLVVIPKAFNSLEIQDLILNYDFQPEVTPENIRSGENTDYQFSPRLLPEEDPAVLRDYSFSP